MTGEDHLRRMIGELVMSVARLAGQVDTLTERVRELEAQVPKPARKQEAKP